MTTTTTTTTTTTHTTTTNGILCNQIVLGDIEDDFVDAAAVTVVQAFRQVLLPHCSHVEVFTVAVRLASQLRQSRRHRNCIKS